MQSMCQIDQNYECSQCSPAILKNTVNHALARARMLINKYAVRRIFRLVSAVIEGNARRPLSQFPSAQDPAQIVPGRERPARNNIQSIA